MVTCRWSRHRGPCTVAVAISSTWTWEVFAPRYCKGMTAAKGHTFLLSWEFAPFRPPLLDPTTFFSCFLSKHYFQPVAFTWSATCCHLLPRYATPTALSFLISSPATTSQFTLKKKTLPFLLLLLEFSFVLLRMNIYKVPFHWIFIGNYGLHKNTFPCELRVI